MSSKKYRRALLKQARSFRVPEGVTLSAINSVLQSLDCPRSLAVSIILRDDPMQLKTLGFNPLHYNNGVEARDAYQATKLVSKADFLKTGLSRKEAAFSKFSQMEDLCKQTNSRFDALALDPNFKGPNVWLYNTTIRKIASILVGYSPEELFDKANWGPGVTTRIKGEMATASNKFQCETGITRDLYYLVADCLTAAYPTWGAHLSEIGFPTFDVGNTVVTVPKDAFTDRVIAVEPGLNLWFQKAIGKMIRTRLLRCGIDLNYQTRNQQLAAESSKDGRLATVDFSSASDSISRSLIREVIPPHWFQIMDAARSHYGIIEGKPRLWNKFSSMGNGFTFELESLIFYAAAFAVCEYLRLDTSTISVFGDDVVLPSPAFDLFSSFSAFLGFKVNLEKSFSSSPFRESCGSHYWDGSDIKPVYIKRTARNLPELFIQTNQIRWWAHNRGSRLFCDSVVKPAWLILYKTIPKALRIFGSFGMGDGFIIGNFDEARPNSARFGANGYEGIQGYYVWQFVRVGVTQRSEEVGLFLARLRNRSEQEYGNNYTLRGRTRLSLTKVLVRQWYDLGPWV